MIRKILEGCPSCGGALEIGEVRCTVCETRVRARYRPCDFCALTEEQSTFLRLFVTSRGNLSEVEKRLGVSYPTVRAKLDEVIERLGAAEVESSGASASMGLPRRPRGAPARAVDPPPVAEGAHASQYPPPVAQTTAERRRILEAVERGEIDATEGFSRLRELGADHEDEG